LSPTALRWHTSPSEALAWREFDGELVVHDARSGNTHLLQPLAGAVLRELLDAINPMSVSELVDRLGADAAKEDVSEWSAAIEAVLSEFQRLGMAAPEQP
jgi:PqqD family protein of HPr-rel-A system